MEEEFSIGHGAVFELAINHNMIVARDEVLELLMAQTLTLLTGDSILRYSTTIGLYLASMGIGAFLCTGKRLAGAVQTLLTAEILLGLVGGSAVMVLHF